MNRTVRLITARPGLVLLALLAITLFALTLLVDIRTGEQKLLLDTSFDSLLPREDENKEYYDHFVARFGTGDRLLVVLSSDDLFSTEMLERVRRLTDRLKVLPNVHHVVSLATAANIQAIDGELSIEPFLDVPPTDPLALAALRENAISDPIYAGNLVSRDGRSAAIIVYPLEMSERELIASGLDEEVSRIANEEAGSATVWVTGGSHIKLELGRLLYVDLARVVPGALAIILIVAFLSFRSVRGVALPLVTVVVGIVWTMAILSAVVGEINQVTSAMPAILIVVGFAYATHVMSAYYDVVGERTGAEADRERDADDVHPAAEALSRVLLPVLLTSATTAIGFISLCTSRLAAIQQFGLFAGIGVVLIGLLSLTFVPAALALLSIPSASASSIRRRHAGSEDRLDKLLRALAQFDIDRRTAILIASAGFSLLAAAGMMMVKVNTDFVRNFQPDNPVRQHFDAVSEALEGASGFFVVVETDYNDAFLEPANLAEIEALQTWLETQPEIGGTTSMVDFLKVINQGFQEGHESAHAIPQSAALIGQLLLFSSTDELDRFVDSRHRIASIAIRSSAIDTRELAALVARIEARLAELPTAMRARVTGNTVIVSKTLDEIALGQALSLSTAFFVIFLILSALFMSFRIGLVALIPNALPVLTYFGIIGWTGVSLNTTTGLVACMVLGIAVDDTIHFLTHFNREAKALADEQRGAVAALMAVGRPVTFTTVALCCGFAVLAFSELRNQAQFGLLASATLALAWLIDVTLTPALALRMRIVTLWDVLTLDLGDQPERTIPLFHGLSHAQARIVALMTSVRSLPAGQPLVRKGDLGDEMYVVIDGALRASVATDAGQVVLRTHTRGDLVGEVALFEGVRSADVDVTEDVRLLCLTRSSLDQLRRRYPRITARLYDNLAAIMASRLSNVTERVR